MKTGEFAAACGIEKRTLFYYDEIGLLKPARVRGNGYREYDAEQIPLMETIKLLQAAGLSLEEIRSVLTAGRKVPASDGRGLAVALECCARIEDKIARLNDSLAYLHQRIRIRESYFASADQPTLAEADGCRVFLEELPMQRAAAITVSGDEKLELRYMKIGYYLGVAEDIRTGKPRFLFKYTDAGDSNVILPAGRYACAFFETASPYEFDIAAKTAVFRRVLDAAGLVYDEIVYLENLPGWIIERDGGVICRFAVRLAESEEGGRGEE